MEVPFALTPTPHWSALSAVMRNDGLAVRRIRGNSYSALHTCYPRDRGLRQGQRVRVRCKACLHTDVKDPRLRVAPKAVRRGWEGSYQGDEPSNLLIR